jgi:hypothetical protein
MRARIPNEKYESHGNNRHVTSLPVTVSVKRSHPQSLKIAAPPPAMSGMDCLAAAVATLHRGKVRPREEEDITAMEVSEARRIRRRAEINISVHGFNDTTPATAAGKGFDAHLLLVRAAEFACRSIAQSRLKSRFDACLLATHMGALVNLIDAWRVYA